MSKKVKSKKKSKPKSKPNRPLSNAELELKITKLELIVMALNGYMVTSQAQEDGLKELFENLEVLLTGVLHDAYNAGHTEDCCSITARIFNGLESIGSVELGKTDK